MLVGKPLFSGLEPSWHVHTAKLSTCQIRGCIQTACKDPGSCQPMLCWAHCSLPRALPCRDIPDDLVADHELVLRPQFWLHFALGFRLKPQVLHGEGCSGLKGGCEWWGAMGWAAPSVLCCAGCSVAPAAQLAWQAGESCLCSTITAPKPQQGWQSFPGINACTGKMIYVRNGFPGRKRKDVPELSAFSIKAELSWAGLLEFYRNLGES